MRLAGVKRILHLANGLFVADAARDIESGPGFRGGDIETANGGLAAGQEVVAQDRRGFVSNFVRNNSLGLCPGIEGPPEFEQERSQFIPRLDPGDI